MEGFQLWVNLPARLKMTDPSYQEIVSHSIPEIEIDKGVKIRLIAGSLDGVMGPVVGIAAEPQYLDVSLPVGGVFSHTVEQEHTVLAYLYRGQALFGDEGAPGVTIIKAPAMIVLSEGNLVRVQSKVEPARFLLMSGKPMLEPIVRYGPFVMNTREEIEQTLKDLRNGTFIK
jgi:hypothetical protein